MNLIQVLDISIPQSIHKILDKAYLKQKIQVMEEKTKISRLLTKFPDKPLFPPQRPKGTAITILITYKKLNWQAWFAEIYSPDKYRKI